MVQKQCFKQLIESCLLNNQQNLTPRFFIACHFFPKEPLISNQISMKFYVLLVLLEILKRGLSASVSAIDSSCPFRSGSVYILYQNMPTLNGTSTVLFKDSLGIKPNGVLLSPQAIQTSDISSNYVDFNFSVGTISTTGFTLITQLSKIYQVNFTKVIVSYWGNSPFSMQVCITRVQSTPSIVTNGSTRTYSWLFTQAGVIDSSSIMWYACAFFVQLIGNFAGKLEAVETDFALYVFNNTFVMNYSFHATATINSVKLSVLIYDARFANASDYTMSFRRMSLASSANISQQFPEEIVYVTMFFGLSEINKNKISTNKFGFYYGFQQDTASDNSFLYKQNNPQKYLLTTQQSNPSIMYSGLYAFFGRRSCPGSVYIYLENITQLCHDKCPLGKYASSNKFCLKCNNCSSISLCTQCYTNGCQEGYYYDKSIAPFKCSVCSSQLPNCVSCFSNSSGGPYCRQCSSVFYLNTTDHKCYECKSSLSNCQTCTVDATHCLSCIASSNTQLIGSVCVSCNSSSYFNTVDQKCESCETSVQYCDSCTFSNGSVACLSCDASSMTELVDPNNCKPCNSTSFYNPSDSRCYSCNSNISNCNRCTFNSISSSLQCLGCDVGNRYFVNLHICELCPLSSFLNTIVQTCTVCHQFCSLCGSETICQQCLYSLENPYILQNSTCVECNPDGSSHPTLPPCFPPAVTCKFSTYNPDTNQCQFSNMTQKLISSFTFITSTPSMNLILRQIYLLINFLDDLSYYTYHNRNYSNEVEAIFKIVMNFTLMRFVPFQLQSLYQSIFLSYQGRILTKTAQQIPVEFEMNDGSVHFLITTEDIWFSTLIVLIITFMIMMFLHWLLNKFLKTNILKSYSYVGMLFVSLLSSNIQYLSFRCFSQLYSMVPIDISYHANLIACYIVLFLVILYSTSSIIIFKTAYNKINHEYVTADLFGQPMVALFYFTAVHKIVKAFIHSYFYYNPFLQTSLLTGMAIIQVIIYTIAAYHSNNQFEFMFQLINHYLFAILQCLFMMESWLFQQQQSKMEQISYFGDYECMIIIILVVLNTSSIVILPFRNLIVSVIGKVGAIRAQRRVVDRIRAVRVTMAHPNNLHLQIPNQLKNKSIKSTRWKPLKETRVNEDYQTQHAMTKNTNDRGKNKQSRTGFHFSLKQTKTNHSRLLT